MEKREKRVPITLHRRLRLLAGSFGPVIAWIGAVIVSGVLITTQTEAITVRGLSDQDKTLITTSVDGRLTSMPFQILDTVNEGDVIGILDDSSVRSELSIIRAESALLQARIDAERERLRAEQANQEQSQDLEVRRLSIDLGRARLDALDRKVELETARIESQRQKADIARYEILEESGAVTALFIRDLRFQLDASEKFIEETAASLSISEQQIKEARLRLDEYQEKSDTAEPVRTDVMIAALSAEADVISERMKSMELSLTNLVMRSPFNGRISAVHSHPGSEIQAGASLAEIVKENTDVIVAWLPDNSEIIPQHGDEAIIRQLGVDGTPTVGEVEEVADSVLPMPLRLLREARFPEYGTPVRIRVTDKSFPTGSKVQVTFTK